MLSPTGLMENEITGATYQFQACSCSRRAPKTPLCDRLQSPVCGPTSPTDHLCFSDSCTHFSSCSPLMPAMSPAQLTYQRPAFYSRKTLHPPCHGSSHILYTHICGGPSRPQSHGIMFLSCQEYQYRKAWLSIHWSRRLHLLVIPVCNGSPSQFQSLGNLKCDKLVYMLCILFLCFPFSVYFWLFLCSYCTVVISSWIPFLFLLYRLRPAGPLVSLSFIHKLFQAISTGSEFILKNVFSRVQWYASCLYILVN